MAKKSGVKGINVKIGADMTPLQTAITNVNKTSRSLTRELGTVNKLLKLDPKNTELVAQKQTLLKESIENTTQKLNLLESAQEQMRQAYEKGEIDGGEYRKFQREIISTKNKLKELESESESLKTIGENAQDSVKDVEKLNNKLDDTSKNAGNITDKGFKTLESGAKVALAAAAAVSGALIKITADSVAVGKEFYAEMSKVYGLSGASGADAEALSEKAKQVGANTKYSATEAAQAFEYMSMAGWKASDMLTGIDGIISAAAASGEDLSTVSDIITDGLTAFGLSAKDSVYFSDLMATASSNANTNISMLGESYKNCAATAGAMGYNVADVTFSLGLMANAGVKGSSAGTALNSVMTRLAKPTKDVSTALNDLNIEAVNADGSMKPLSDLLPELRTKFDELSESERGRYATMIAGKNAMSGFLTLMNASTEDYNKLRTAIDNCDGAAQKMSATMEDNLQGDLTKLGSGLEGVKIQIYESFDKPLRSATKEASKAVSNVSKALNNEKTQKSLKTIGDAMKNGAKSAGEFAEKALPKLIDGLAFVTENSRELATATGAAVLALKGYEIGNKIGGIINAVTTAQQSLNAAMTANPIGVMIASVGALVAAYNLLNAVTVTRDEYIQEATSASRDEYEQIQDNIQAYKDLKLEKEEAALADLTQIGRTKDLWGELQTLCDENGNVKKGYEDRAKFIVDELEDKLGIEIQYNDGVIKSYQKLQEEINRTIEMQRAEIILNLEKELYDEAIKNKPQAFAKLSELQSQNSTYQKQLEHAMRNYGRTRTPGYTETGHLLLDQREYELGIEAAKKNVENTQNSISEQRELIKNYLVDIARYETDSAKLASGDLEKIAEVNARYEASYIKNGEVVEKTLKEQYDEAVEMQKLLIEESRKSGSEITTQMLIDAKKQVETTKAAWEASEGIVSDSTDSMVNTVKDGADEAGKAVEYAVDETGKTVKKKSEDIGRNISKGIITGLHAEQENLNTAFGVSINSLIKHGQNVAEIKSPSKRAKREIGRFFPLGIAEGIKEETPSMLKVAQDSMNALFSEEQSSLMLKSTAQLRSIGSALSEPVVVENQTSSENGFLQVFDTFASNVLSRLERIEKATKKGLSIDGKSLVGYVDEELGGLIE